MTFNEIERTKLFLNEVETVNNYDSMQKLKGELKGFYGQKFNLNLKIKMCMSAESYTSVYVEHDKASIRSFLESVLATDDKTSIICDVIDLMREGEGAKNNPKASIQYVAKVYHSYSGVIQFDKTIESIASSAILPDFYAFKPDNYMIDGINAKLKNYAMSILNKSTKEKEVSPIQINTYSSSNSSASADNNLSVENIFVEARNKVADEGLAEAQMQEVLKKISEIEDISKSKESRGKRWSKAKEILKWVVEQGIQVAGIVLPLLVPMIK